MELTVHFVPNTRKYKRMTLVGVYDEQIRSLSFGLSSCSKRDQFIKKYGRKMAIQRAQKTPFNKMIFDVDKSKRELLNFMYAEVDNIKNNATYYVILQSKKVNKPLVDALQEKNKENILCKS